MPPQTPATSQTTAPSRLEQQRALRAYELVKTVGNDSAYLSRARDLPIMIRTNGIGQTVAFLMDHRGDGAEAQAKKKILEHLEAWLRERPFYATSRPPNVLPALLAGSRENWWRATNEAILFATWLKRWAEALIEGKAEKSAAAHESSASESGGGDGAEA